MTNRVYVELDALLDTRLAVVSSLDEQAAVKLVTSDSYYRRQIDDFSEITGISRETFREAYRKRDADVLPRSIKTHIPLMLAELMHHLEYQEETTPEMEGLSLEVNIWPYTDLTDSEREQIMLAVLCHAGIQTLPVISCYDPKELTPRRIKSQYSGLILYNFRDWLEHHLPTFPKCICPDVTIIAPALFHDKVVETRDVIDDPGFRTELSLLTLTEAACSEFFQLNLIDPKYFSIWRDGI